jgi:malate dehydrogenase
MRPKITVVGSGNVGATTALYLAQKELGDIVLIDVLEGIPQGKGLDMYQAGPILGFDARILGSNDYKDTADSDLVIITAGLARKPGMDRLDLLRKNQEIIKQVVEGTLKYSKNPMILVVSNPVDVMTYYAHKISGLDSTRVFGQAGVLDAGRFAAFIALELNVSVKDISAMVLGGHGDSMVPLPSYTTVSGVPIIKLMSKEKIAALSARTQTGGGEIVNLLKTGSAYYAPAAATAIMAESIIKDQKRILPTSVFPRGKYGLDGIYIGLPAILGRAGVEDIIELELSAEESAALHKSAEVYKKSVAEL